MGSYNNLILTLLALNLYNDFMLECRIFSHILKYHILQNTMQEPEIET